MSENFLAYLAVAIGVGFLVGVGVACGAWCALMAGLGGAAIYAGVDSLISIGGD